MTFTTFGAIMGFAAEIVAQTEEIYGTLSEEAEEPELKEILKTLLKEEKRNHPLMEKMRRENVTEMILEPIPELPWEDYKIHYSVQDRMEDADILKLALILEERERKFFRDASSKVPLPEVASRLRKMVQKKEENLARLQRLGMSRSSKGVLIAAGMKINSF
jgi:hypothetical protein